MGKKSAGILLYRKTTGKLEVLLVHPGGPFYTHKDLGSWSIPKGEYKGEEEPLAAAIREVEEEVGERLDGEFLPLGQCKLGSGKRIMAWAQERDLDPTGHRSSILEREWPKGSGQIVRFPELDKAEWFELDLAKEKIHPAQIVFLEELYRQIE